MNSYRTTEENDVHLDFGDKVRNRSAPKKDGMKETGTAETIEKNLNDFLEKHKSRLAAGRNLLLLLLYLAYYSYAMYCNFGDEESIRLTVFTGFGLACLSWMKLQKWGKFERFWKGFLRQFHEIYSSGRRRLIIRWSLYLVWTALFVVYIVINVAMEDATKLRSLGGMAAYLFVLFLFSNNRRLINWHCVFYGTILQCLFGLFVIKTSAGVTVLMWFSDRLSEFLAYADVGSRFVFGDKFLDHPYAMQVVPQIIMFVAVISVLIHLGAIQFIVRLVGASMAYVMDVSAPEAINAASNILLGGAEASATILEYLSKMPTSRLFCVCVGGFASCSGSSLIQFRSFGIPLQYLLAASAMSAPAAIVCAKIVFPDVEEVTDEEKNVQDVTLVAANRSKPSERTSENPASLQGENETELDDKPTESGKLQNSKDEANEMFPLAKNVGEALVVGTKNGLKLSASVVSLLIVSFAIIELLNETVEWLGDRVNVDVTFNKILSYLFYPFVYVMGVDTEDCLRGGEFLGLRTLATPGIPYIYLGQLVRNREIVANYSSFAASFNQTLTYDRSDDIFLPIWNVTLPGGFISPSIIKYIGCPFMERSEVILTYALCGFASLPVLGITFGLITTFIPQRLPEITAVPIRLLVAGTTASYLTACVAGLLT